MPRATMARLSPTSTTSTPAASATCALGKSCAVITAMGSPRLRIARSVPTVTFFRGGSGGDNALPMGECELHLCCCRDCGNVDGGKGSATLARSVKGAVAVALCDRTPEPAPRQRSNGAHDLPNMRMVGCMAGCDMAWRGARDAMCTYVAQLTVRRLLPGAEMF